MNFKINFKLQDLDKIMPFGEEPHFNLHWFGLTDGFLWLDVGDKTIYEYSKAAQNYFDNCPRYNDYQISRFLEDFSLTFQYIAEPVPKELYDIVDRFGSILNQWAELHEDDDENDCTFDNDYYGLSEWYGYRSFDSGHLVGGPYISFFRYEDNIKILWESAGVLENGEYIWTAPKGMLEISYKEFVTETKRFFEAFFISMDKQVNNALLKDWGKIELDKESLVKENQERKQIFRHKLSFLDDTPQETDWQKIFELYRKMKNDLYNV